MTLGTTDCIQGLEIGLAGDEGPMPAMKYVIPKFIQLNLRQNGRVHSLGNRVLAVRTFFNDI